MSLRYRRLRYKWSHRTSLAVISIGNFSGARRSGAVLVGGKRSGRKVGLVHFIWWRGDASGTMLCGFPLACLPFYLGREYWIPGKAIGLPPVRGFGYGSAS